MVADVKTLTMVDAVDAIDTSFHNLTTNVEENHTSTASTTTFSTSASRGPNNKDSATESTLDGDEDFDAFVGSARLKEEEEELQKSIPNTTNVITEEEQHNHMKSLTESNEALQKGPESKLVVNDAVHQTPISGNETQPITPDLKRFLSPKDFELLKVIGMGAFGKVLQVRTKTTNKILAMKVISKRLLNRKSSYAENIQAERNILTRVRHPFVVMMHAVSFICFDFLSPGAFLGESLIHFI